MYILIYIVDFQGISKLPPNQNQKGNHYVVFRVMTPKNLTREQEILFNDIRSIEQPVDQASAHAQARQDEKRGASRAEEDSSAGDGIFEKFKNMWSKNFNPNE